MNNIAKINIKNNFQKRQDHYSDLLTNDILKDIVLRTTGQDSYIVEYEDAVNIGRLLTIEFKETKTFVSLSEDQPNGRNSYFQSFPSALIRYKLDQHPCKIMAFYFITTVDKINIETDYHQMMYKLMATVGTKFINSSDYLSKDVQPFSSVEQYIYIRSSVLKRKQNNSTYVTIDEKDNVNIYAKTYGANKKESTLIILALNNITNNPIVVYMFKEGNLSELPRLDISVIEQEHITLVTTDNDFELHEYEKNNSLRSPKYISNLLAHLGSKTCAICDCDIPQLIQGAHILPVANIKRISSLTTANKLLFATDGENGIWLCNNHHKMFDSGIIDFSNDGHIIINKFNLSPSSVDYVNSSLSTNQLSDNILTHQFIFYLKERHKMTS